MLKRQKYGVLSEEALFITEEVRILKMYNKYNKRKTDS